MRLACREHGEEVEAVDVQLGTMKFYAKGRGLRDSVFSVYILQS